MTRIPNSMEICMLPEEPAVPASRWWEPPTPLAFSAALARSPLPHAGVCLCTTTDHVSG